MRLAFVLRLGNDSRPADAFFEGWIEEVDSYKELRFRSTDELLRFLGDRFDRSAAAHNRHRKPVRNKTRPRTRSESPALFEKSKT